MAPRYDPLRVMLALSSLLQMPLVFVAAVIMMVLTVDRTLDLEKFWDRWLI